MVGTLQYCAASQLGASIGVIMTIQIQHSTSSSVSSNRFVVTKPSKLFKFQNKFYYKFLIKQKIFFYFLQVYSDGQVDSRKSYTSQENISTVDRSFLISKRLINIFMWFLIQNSKVWKTCIFRTILYILALYLDQVNTQVRQVSYYVIIKDLKDD